MEGLVSGWPAAEEASEEHHAVDREAHIKAIRGVRERVCRGRPKAQAVRPRDREVRRERPGVEHEPALPRCGGQAVGEVRQPIGAGRDPDPQAARARKAGKG